MGDHVTVKESENDEWHVASVTSFDDEGAPHCCTLSDDNKRWKFVKVFMNVQLKYSNVAINYNIIL